MEPDFAKGNGLITAVAQDWKTGEVLMIAFMDRVAWEKTLSTGKVHYHSRSRNRTWMKGEESGHIQNVKEILVDCDADCALIRVEQIGGAACHTGFRTCFHRRVKGDELETIGSPVFDPAKVYRK